METKDLVVLNGERVDLISPFPFDQIHRLWGWTRPRSLRNYFDADPEMDDKEVFLERMQEVLPSMPSWGIVDKHCSVGGSHPAPLVGVLALEPAGPHNGYFHIAARRKTPKLVKEAATLVVDHLFTTTDLLRLSAWVPEGNRAAAWVAQRAGFREEARLEDMILVDGVPGAIRHFGITKRSWQCQCKQQPPEEASLPALSEEAESREADRKAASAPVPGLPLSEAQTRIVELRL